MHFVADVDPLVGDLAAQDLEPHDFIVPEHAVQYWTVPAPPPPGMRANEVYHILGDCWEDIWKQKGDKCGCRFGCES